MQISILGSVGIGLVIGWLLGSLDGHMKRPILTFTVIGLFLFTVSLEIFLFVSWRGIGFFLGGAIFASLIRIGWHREIQNRIEASSHR